MSGIGVAGGGQPAGELSLDQPGDRRRTGEHHALHPRVGDDSPSDLAGARQERERLWRNARRVQNSDRLGGDQRRLLGGFGDHRIAGGERRGDLAGEDRQRKVPRADAGDDSERRRRAGAENADRLGGVKAEEIGGLAHFADRVGVSLARLAHDEADEFVVELFEPVGGAAQDRRPLVRRNGGPGGRGRSGGGDRGKNLVGAGVARDADDVAAIGRIGDRFELFAGSRPGRRGPARHAGARLEPCAEFREPLFVGEIEPARVEALCAVKMPGERDPWVRRADRLDLSRHRDRIGDELFHRDARVGDAVDEGGVRPVLQEAPHEIGEQRLVRADRGVDAARPVEFFPADDFLIQRLAHAVQALELILAAIKIRPGHRHDGGERLGVVGGELRKDRVRGGKQLARAGEIADVGVDLAGEDGEAFQPVDLGALDLRIPVGAFDEAHHQPAARAPREVDEKIDDEGAALAVGLDDEAEAVPAGEIGVEAERFQKVERQVEPLRFLGVDVEADVVGFGQRGEMSDAR